jgi:hypothetical protein
MLGVAVSAFFVAKVDCFALALDQIISGPTFEALIFDLYDFHEGYLREDAVFSR